MNDSTTPPPGESHEPTTLDRLQEIADKWWPRLVEDLTTENPRLTSEQIAHLRHLLDEIEARRLPQGDER